jgi:hypothetical protein
MCAMDQVAHFPMGHLAPPPMGQTATPTAKKLANACAKVSIYRQCPGGAGPYVRMPAAGFGHEQGGRDPAPSGKEPTPQQYTLLEDSADGPNGPFLFHLDFRVDPACWP